MLTGRPGSGKSMLIESVANELSFGRVVRWHVTSSSTLKEALYRYDAVGRLQELQLSEQAPDITDYLILGPLGTALLPTRTPRALLIDEIDKADIDLPNDMLNVFERGEFEIPELARVGGSHTTSAKRLRARSDSRSTTATFAVPSSRSSSSRATASGTSRRRSSGGASGCGCRHPTWTC